MDSREFLEFQAKLGVSCFAIGVVVGLVYFALRGLFVLAGFTVI